MFLISVPTGYEWLIILLVLVSIPTAILVALFRYLWHKGSNEKKKHRQ